MVQAWPEPPRRQSDLVKKFIAEEVDKWVQDRNCFAFERLICISVGGGESKRKDWRFCVDFICEGVCINLTGMKSNTETPIFSFRFHYYQGETNF